MRRVTIGASYIVAPMLAALVVVVLFLPGVALQAAFGDLLWRLVLEGANLCLVAPTFHVRLARTVTRFAALALGLPSCRCELGVSGLLEAAELLFVAGLAGLASNIIFGRVPGGGGRLRLLLITRVCRFRKRA